MCLETFPLGVLISYFLFYLGHFIKAEQLFEHFEIIGTIWYALAIINGIIHCYHALIHIQDFRRTRRTAKAIEEHKRQTAETQKRPDEQEKWTRATEKV